MLEEFKEILKVNVCFIQIQHFLSWCSFKAYFENCCNVLWKMSWWQNEIKRKYAIVFLHQISETFECKMHHYLSFTKGSRKFTT